MKYVWKIIFICIYCSIFTKCLIPTLTVRTGKKKHISSLSSWQPGMSGRSSKIFHQDDNYRTFKSLDNYLNFHKDLNVDQKLIERRRQDTLEICRLFNEENKFLEIVNATNTTLNETRRVKREIRHDVENPLLKPEDVARVENIVDKLYDEMEQNGDHITYRRRNLIQETKLKESKNITNRRFNFAPAELLGPSSEDDDVKKINETNEVPIHWIKKWKHGIIPFFIDPSTYDSLLSETILKTFDYIEKVTCLRLQRLRERPTDKESLESVEWLYITNPSGLRQCVHSNEQKPNSGVQMVVLGYDCLSQGEISHEIMHVLGFSHEHTRADRDQHIEIVWNNIKPGYKKYFEVRKEDSLLALPYDYASVLHYPPRAFSKNGQLTVIAQAETKIGQREALSEMDVEKVGMIYGAECVRRNKDYLLKTCPSAVKTNFEAVDVSQVEIEKYFENRLWPYGVVNYKIRDKFEFTAEERDNIKAVLKHIEKETCIEFRDVAENDGSGDRDDDNEIEDDNLLIRNDSITHKPRNTVQNDDENQTVTQPDNDETEMTLKASTSVELPHKESNEKKNEVLTLRRNYQHGDQSRAKTNTKPTSLNPHIQKSGRSIFLKRRHSDNVIIFGRSSKPGCTCPDPGRPNKKSVLDINADCFNSVNDLLHMFVHVLGLDHQHNMHDRDSYLHIMWSNLTQEIKNEMKEKLPPAASAGFSYDYQSVMHYPWLQIKDGSTNIMYPIWNDGWAMGHWQGLSLTDVNKINFIYKSQCSERQREANN